MKKAPHTENSFPSRAICLLDTHYMVIALSQYVPKKGTYEITYAHQSRIVHNDTLTPTEKLSKVYDIVLVTFQKFLNDVQMKPDSVEVFLGDSLSSGIYRKHTMRRTTAFSVTEKLLENMKSRDYNLINQKTASTYRSPHTITHTDTVGRTINGYPFTDDQKKLPEKVFSLEHVYIHTLVPVHLQTKLTEIISGVYHTDINITFRNISSVIIPHIGAHTSGSWLYVHIGESVTTLASVSDHMITDIITIPVGTSQVTESIMTKLGLSLAETVRLLQLANDQRVDDASLSSLRETIHEFWTTWRKHVTTQLEKMVQKGVTISKVIYSYDTEYLHVDQYVFPQEPHELWYGSRSVVHVPCESILAHSENTLSRVYIRSVLLHIQQIITK